MSQTNTHREKKIRSILERSSNIDAQTLQKYTDKKLTKEELHEIEKQLLNSDFAAEALEGFSKADFKVNIVRSTKDLNREIKKYNKERGFYKTDYRIFYAAASVALLFVVLFGLFRLTDTNFSLNNVAMENQVEQSKNPNTENTNVALNEENALSEKEENELVEKLKNENLEEVEKLETNKNSNQNTTKTENNLALNNIDKKENSNKKDFSTSDIWINKREKIETQSDQTPVLGNSSNNVSSSPIVSGNIQKNEYSDSSLANAQLADDDYTFFSDKEEKRKMAQKKKSPKETLFDAMQSYENKKYTDAILLFNSYLVTSPNDAQALYFGGMSYYQNHDYNKAIPLLEKFLKQTSSSNYQKNNQDAEWFLAESYQKTNQKQKAKTLLEKIANSTSKYASQAKTLLKK